METVKRIAEIRALLDAGGLEFEKIGALEMELEGLEQEIKNNPPAAEEQKTETPVVAPATPATVAKTHWKKLKNPDYLGSYDFQPNEERTLTIKSVYVKSVEAEKTTDCTIVEFLEKSKPMILNSTNGKMLAKLFETPYIEEWVGRSFKVVVKSIKAFGEVVDALRVKNEKIAKQKPQLILDSKTFVNCKERYQKDKSALTKIKEHYWMTPETEKALTA